jgi:hypothetical protein
MLAEKQRRNLSPGNWTVFFLVFGSHEGIFWNKSGNLVTYFLNAPLKQLNKKISTVLSNL